MTRSTQEVFDSHREAIENLDMEQLAGDYAEDACMVTLDGTFMGRESIMKDFFGSWGQFPDMKIHFDKVVCEGEICLLQWSAEASNMTVPVGLGILFVEDGLIQRQVEWFQVATKEE